MAKKTISSTLQSPTPLLNESTPVTWWFAFKLNSKHFPGVNGKTKLPKRGRFGGHKQQGYDSKGDYSLQYVVASSKQPILAMGNQPLGSTLNDPLGATFNQVYNGSPYFVLWNDQFYGNPIETRKAPWGHSKGLLAWDDSGKGFVLQVTTPSWPGSGSKKHPRHNDGNTLGYVHDDDVEVSQHFFALKLTKTDVASVLKSLINARVVTDPTQPSIANIGGPQQLQELAETLGQKPDKPTCLYTKLSSGIEIISKSVAQSVPPWQLVSAQLDSVPLRVASWWAHPKIPSTTATTKIGCWQKDLGIPGAVEIATSGTWDETSFSLLGGTGLDRNHAKFGVSTDSSRPLCIFGDMNQQGSLLKSKATSSQNGRGGTFYVLRNKRLFKSLTELLKGDTA